MRLSVTDYIAQFLHAQAIDHVFEVAGGMITHLLDALHRQARVRIVSVHHEQAAAFAADAYGRVTGKPGVALATSGPGATNLLTGIASCYFDSSPALFITGQVNTFEQKGTRAIRQLGFQETDIIAMVAPIIKQSFKVEAASQVEQVMIEAYTAAISGRPGPVLIDLPMNIQRESIDVAPIKKITRQLTIDNGLQPELSVLQQHIASAQRPLILAGGGVRCANANKELLQLIESIQIPVVTSLLGLDVIPYSHSLRVGFIGTYGNRWANLALSQADLLIVIGSRLDVRQTGADVAQFKANKRIVHIDCEAGEVNNRLTDCLAIIADIRNFLIEANQAYSKTNWPPWSAWYCKLEALKQQWSDLDELKNFSGINPNYFMHALSRHSNAAVGYAVDVGNHQMWAAQSLEIASHQVFLTSGGMGAMGFALPAAMGLSLASGLQPVVVIAGDGAFQMNIQELQTVVRNKIPLKIIIINNNCLGMIRQFQDSYFEGRYQSTYWGYDAPDFTAIAQAYGLPAKTINQSDEISMGTEWLWTSDGPCLLQVMVHAQVNVYPKIAFGRPISEMEPFVKPVAMEST